MNDTKWKSGKAHHEMRSPALLVICRKKRTFKATPRWEASLLSPEGKKRK
jgi:hypothetical protein